MGVYKEGKNWKVQVYYKDWRGMCLRTKHFLFAAVPVVLGSRPPSGRYPVRRNHQRPG